LRPQLTKYPIYLFNIFIYFKNPLRIIISYLRNAETIAVLKNNTEIKIGKDEYLATFGCLVPILRRGWIIEYDKDRNWKIRGRDFIILQPRIGSLSEDLSILKEDLESMYVNKSIMNGKVILDVGGYIGETAIIFIKRGNARKVIIFEPIERNLQFIRANMELNGLSGIVEICPYAITDIDGYVDLYSSSPPGYGNFGLSHGKYHLNVRSLSWANALNFAADEGVSIAKIDCEGSEQYLAYVDDSIIRKIPLWIIEIHSYEIEQKLLDKFTFNGFKCERIAFLDIKNGVSIYKINNIV
jgi:FkbM family methyltransferase